MSEETRPHIIRDLACTFCNSSLQAYMPLEQPEDPLRVDCPCCGTFRITGTAITVIAHWELTPAHWAAIAYQVRRMTGRVAPPRLDEAVLRAIKETAQRLPHPDQIVDDFVLWAGLRSRWPGDTIDMTYTHHRTLLGAVGTSEFDYMLRCIAQSGYFRGNSAADGLMDCSLTPSGWAHLRELSTSRMASRYGFMAMKYNDAELDAIVRGHFVPQVNLAGFELRRLDDGQPAGLIDDQLRLLIRQARFLVCDLTHGNRGAYWEAGYAEGLGVPVIYTCRQDVFADPSHECHPHFDAAHWVTVPWDPANPAPAAAKLKTTVRATLPADAKLED